MKIIMRLATAKPITIPMPTAASALMIRLRNSTRWSKNDIAAPESSSARGRRVGSGVAALAIAHLFGIQFGFGRRRLDRRIVLREVHLRDVGIVNRVRLFGGRARLWRRGIAARRVRERCGIWWIRWHCAKRGRRL